MGQENMAVEQKLDRLRRLAMQERLVEGTVGRVEEMGLLPQEIARIPEAYVANLKQPKQLERIPSIGDKAEVPETLKGIGRPKTGNVRDGTTRIGKPGQR